MRQPINLKRATELIGQWLWGNRKVLVSVLAAVSAFELLFNIPTHIYWWIGLLAGVLILASWWTSNLSFRSYKLWIVIGQMLWVTAAGVGYVIFNLVLQWQFQITALIMGVLWFGLFSLYQSYGETGSWPVRALPVLDFVDLLAFFFAGASLMMAGDFYSLPVVWIILGFTLQAIFGLILRFLREDLSGLRKWLYALVAILITEEIVWVASFWHRGVFLRTFFVSVVFYLMADFIDHYSRGQLTVKVAMEYVGLVLAVLVGVLIVDGFLVLR